MTAELTQEISSRLIGLTDAMADYSTRIKISIDKVWGTPTEG